MSSEVDRRALEWREWLTLALAAAVIVAIRGRGFEGMVSNDNVATWLYSWQEVWPALQAGRRPLSFHWPPLYPWVVGALLYLFGDGWGTVWPRLLSGVASVLFGGGVLRLGLELGFPRVVARLSAAVCLASALVWQMTLVVSADLLSQALVLWGFVAVLTALRGSGSGWPLAGCWFGLALLSRWAILIHGVTVAALWLAGAFRTQRGVRPRGSSLGRWFVLGGAGAVIFLGAVGILLWSRQSGPGPYAPGAGSWSAIWTVEAWFLRVFDTRDGVLSYALPNLAFYLFAACHPAALGPFAALLPVGVVEVLRRGSVEQRLLLLIWPATVVLFLSGFELQNPRFLLMLIPAQALLAVFGGAALWTRLGAAGGRRRGAARLVTGIALLVLVATAWVRTGRLMRGAADRVAVAEAVLSLSRASLDPVPILSFEVTPWIRWRLQASGGVAIEPPILELHDSRPEQVVELVRVGGSALLVYDPLRIEEQWRERPAGRAVEALHSASNLQPETVAEIGRWRIEKISFAVSDAGDSDLPNAP